MPQNFRESFEVYEPNSNGSRWTQTLGNGDIAFVDGNAVAASYLVLSKSPLYQDTVSTITAIGGFSIPLELSTGLCMSQRTLGQEFGLELLDNLTRLDPVPDIAIASISQSTTTLTVNTATPHGLVPGKRIGISGVNDSRMNYNALVVATIPSPTQFTATAGPGGTIPSLTVGPFTTGFVYFRPGLSSAQNGVSYRFENASVTNACIYTRADAGDALPSGTANGNHTITVGTTAPIQAVNAAYTYAFQPTTEYSIKINSGRVQCNDVGVDSVSAPTARFTRSQVVPDASQLYSLNITARNNKSLSVPVARIVSATKTASTTATIVTDVPHGLTTADVVCIYGIRDQAATSFPNLTTATTVASVVDANTFTIVIGSSGTATSYGGTVVRVNGGNLPSALGYIAQVGSSAVLTNGILTVTGNASWSGLLVGDSVQLHGFRVDGTGADLGVDGAWKVRSVGSAILELEPLPTGVVLPADFTSTNCGGAVIKRTDIRISYVRMFNRDRTVVEVVPTPATDAQASVPVVVTAGSVSISGTPAVTLTSTAVAGSQGANSSTIVNPVPTGVYGVSANTTAITSGRAANTMGDLHGRQVVQIGNIAQVQDKNRVAISSTTETTMIAAVASIRHILHDLVIANTSTTNPVTVDIRDTTAGTIRMTFQIPAGQTVTWSSAMGSAQGAVNTNWTAQLTGTSPTVTLSTNSYRVGY